MYIQTHIPLGYLEGPLLSPLHTQCHLHTLTISQVPSLSAQPVDFLHRERGQALCPSHLTLVFFWKLREGRRLLSEPQGQARLQAWFSRICLESHPAPLQEAHKAPGRPAWTHPGLRYPLPLHLFRTVRRKPDRVAPLKWRRRSETHFLTFKRSCLDN
jgi:hypothetical protein